MWIVPFFNYVMTQIISKWEAKNQTILNFKPAPLPFCRMSPGSVEQYNCIWNILHVPKRPKMPHCMKNHYICQGLISKDQIWTQGFGKPLFKRDGKATFHQHPWGICGACIIARGQPSQVHRKCWQVNFQSMHIPLSGNSSASPQMHVDHLIILCHRILRSFPNTKWIFRWTLLPTA